MEQIKANGQPQSSRWPLVDFIRAVAVLLMVYFHFFYDLTMFGVLNIDFQKDWFWWGLPRVIVFLFLLAVGAGLRLVHYPHIRWKKFGKRFALLAFWALAISLSTYYFFPSRWIYFGTLHCIATCSLMSLPFLSWPRLSLVVGSLMLILAFAFKINIPWIILPHWSMDYIPAFPWLGVCLIAIAGHHWNLHTKGQFLNRPEWKWALFIGRHSLFIYILHQPLMYGIMYLIFTLKAKLS